VNSGIEEDMKCDQSRIFVNLKKLL
jgi:hypothetical protein